MTASRHRAAARRPATTVARVMHVPARDTVRAAPRRARIVAAAVAAAIALAGCATSNFSIYDYLPVPPAFSLRWLWDSKKPGPLPELKPSATASVSWQASVGKAVPGFAPVALPDAIYVAAVDGSLTRLDPANGRQVWRTQAGKTISAGPGADADTIVVGTDKGEVLAFDNTGKPKWTVRVPTEIMAPPRVSDGVVTVFVGDGSIHAFNAADGAKKWVNQRIAPPLTVRNYAGGTSTRGGLFFGTAGGRLLALDITTGIVGWDATVANPRGATELERIADVTSLPLVDGNQVCAVAYQGRVACFEITRGTLNWSRDISSLAGIAGDGKNIFVTDDKGVVQALDRTNGASVWKQDRLAARKIGGPQALGDFVAVIDVEGYVHLLSAANGAYVGRLQTDGTPATGQPAPFLSNILWQSAGGNVYAVTAR